MPFTVKVLPRLARVNLIYDYTRSITSCSKNNSVRQRHDNGRPLIAFRSKYEPLLFPLLQRLCYHSKPMNQYETLHVSYYAVGR